MDWLIGSWLECDWWIGFVSDWFWIDMRLSDLHRIVLGLVDWRWFGIALPYLTLNLGVGLDCRWNGRRVVWGGWPWIGTGLALNCNRIGNRLLYGRRWIGIRLAMDRHEFVWDLRRIGIRFTSDWQWIDIGLTMDWFWIGKGLALHWQWIGFARLLWAVSDGVSRHFGGSRIVLVPSGNYGSSVRVDPRLSWIGIGMTYLWYVWEGWIIVPVVLFCSARYDRWPLAIEDWIGLTLWCEIGWAFNWRRIDGMVDDLVFSIFTDSLMRLHRFLCLWCMGNGLAFDWCVYPGLAIFLRIGIGLIDWRYLGGFALEWWIVGQICLGWASDSWFDDGSMWTLCFWVGDGLADLW